ncbi:ABC transporter substrate-binding protein [Fontibacillus sp. BL9]|uniref:ABC transporter substrate-binding protein n=1 Tax=Fontibacillus sp. BL9 TaxID=3389971 RepID=UPI00397CF5B2
MKLHRQFLQLHARYGSNHNTPVEVTLDELAAVLGCTHRSALTIIHKMEACGWIGWASQRGRGARSALQFRMQPGEIAAQSVMQAIHRKDIGQAIEDIRRHNGSSSLPDHLHGWLLTYFGHHAEIRRNRQIDTLRLPVRQQIHTVDPVHMNLLAEAFVAGHVFDGLTRRDNPSGEIIPGIAHAWETDESRTVWTFFLRKGVLFHNGSLLTAEDVVYTFRRLAQNPYRTLYSYIFKQIKTVQALNQNTVRMELHEPSELFLPCLSTSRASIVPRHLDQRGEALFGTRPVGSGPFKVVEMCDNMCVLEAFPHYYQGQVHLDRVEIVHVPWELPGTRSDDSDAWSPFHLIPNPSADIGGAGGQTPKSLITQQTGKTQQTEQTQQTHQMHQMHSQVSVRKFITGNTRNNGPLSDPATRSKVFSILRQEAEAQDLTAQVPIALRIATIAPYKPDADFVARQLEAAGYGCEVLTSSAEAFKGTLRLECDLIIFSLVRDRDEQLRLFDLYQTVSKHVDSHTQTDIEQALRNVAREPDPLARNALFAGIENMLIEGDELHILYEKPVQTAVLPTVRGVTFNSQGWVDLRNIWFPPQL